MGGKTDPHGERIGHVPDGWSPYVSVIRTEAVAGRVRGRRWVCLKVGASHIALRDGTIIEPMQAQVPIRELDMLIRELEEARKWIDDAGDDNDLEDEY